VHRIDPGDEVDHAFPRSVVERTCLKALEAVYRQADLLVAGQSCPKSGECCKLATTGREPFLLPLEQLALSRALARGGRQWPEARADGACAFLDETGARCSIYPDRPFGCRTFFCERVEGRTPSCAAIHQASARLTAASDQLEPQGVPVQISRLFAK
jgi:Fe-S-cluster containining protein